jgi:hypothetical protein
MEEVRTCLTVVRHSFTRPNDAGTVAYAQYDVVGANLGTLGVIGTLSNFARLNAGAGYLTCARLMVGGTNGAGSNMSYRVFLYATPPAAILDNGVMPLMVANFANRIGYLDFDCNTYGAGSDSSVDQLDNINKRFWTGTSTRDIYYIVTMRAARLAPASETYQFELSADAF